LAERIEVAEAERSTRLPPTLEAVSLMKEEEEMRRTEEPSATIEPPEKTDKRAKKKKKHVRKMTDGVKVKALPRAAN
jgi:hypothetical protein